MKDELQAAKCPPRRKLHAGVILTGFVFLAAVMLLDRYDEG